MSQGREKLAEISEAIEHIKSVVQQDIHKDTDAAVSEITNVASALHGIIDMVKEFQINKLNEFRKFEDDRLVSTLKKLE